MNNICTSTDNDNHLSIRASFVFRADDLEAYLFFSDKGYVPKYRGVFSHTSPLGRLLFFPLLRRYAVPSFGAHYAPEQINSKHLFVTCSCCMQLSAVSLNEISLIPQWNVCDLTRISKDVGKVAKVLAFKYCTDCKMNFIRVSNFTFSNTITVN